MGNYRASLEGVGKDLTIIWVWVRWLWEKILRKYVFAVDCMLSGCWGNSVVGCFKS